MKIRGIIFFISSLFFIQSAYANITLSFLGPDNKNICEYLAGTWVGSGTVATHRISCQYTGVVTVVPGDKPSEYLAETTLILENGICPAAVELKMSGSCKNNKVTLQNDKTSLSGSIDSAGKVADLSGYVYFEVFSTVIKATLSNVHLLKSDGPITENSLIHA